MSFAVVVSIHSNEELPPTLSSVGASVQTEGVTPTSAALDEALASSLAKELFGSG